MQFSRAHLAVLALSLAALAVAGAGSVVLFALPFVALAALLLTGRFYGEGRILAFHRARRITPARRAPALRWRPARPARARSLFARSPRTLRGPPARFTY